MDSRTEREALSWYVRARPLPGAVESGATQFLSCFWAALRDARKVTGRDVETGKVVSDGNTGTWLGALGYLVLLDQIGTVVTRTRPGPAPKASNSFVSCVKDFAPQRVSERDLEALYALRCSFAHDFGLVNVGRGRNANRMHFLFTLDTVGPLLEHARRRWTGDFSVMGPSHSTAVNLRALGDLVEGSAANVHTAYQAGKLKPRLTADEILVRYSIIVNLPTSPAAGAEYADIEGDHSERQL